MLLIKSKLKNTLIKYSRYNISSIDKNANKL
jgi:hypothetical protein